MIFLSSCHTQLASFPFFFFILSFGYFAMLLNKLKERWASRKSAKSSFSPEKRIKILTRLQKYVPIVR